MAIFLWTHEVQIFSKNYITDIIAKILFWQVMALNNNKINDSSRKFSVDIFSLSIKE